MDVEEFISEKKDDTKSYDIVPDDGGQQNDVKEDASAFEDLGSDENDPPDLSKRGSLNNQTST
jgi:hypothetical protein